MEVLDKLVLSPVFKTGVGCEEHPGQVRFLCASAVQAAPCPAAYGTPQREPSHSKMPG